MRWKAKSGDIRVWMNMVDPYWHVNESIMIADYQIVNFVRLGDEGRYSFVDSVNDEWFYPLWDGIHRKAYFPEDYEKMEQFNFK